MTTNMTSNENIMRETLSRIAGVQPSQHWLQDCQTELRMTGAANCTADAVLQQILHHDLRDVVRIFPAENTNGTTATADDSNHPSVLLRRAVQESLTAQHNYKSQLPASFRLLVQVEELLDVSQNAETRLSVGPASPNAPAATGNQQNRCLKLCLSDGYPLQHEHSNNENNSNNGSMIFDTRQRHQSSVFMAMEVEPIPTLSVNSKAGIKVIMQGPLQIRHGVLLLQPVYRPAENDSGTAAATNNAAPPVQQITVLGGSVAELVEIQSTALQQAKLVAGVGVDPTVRALIWNPETGETQEEDEGEHESRDLEPGAPPPPPVQQPVVRPPPQQQRFRAAPPNHAAAAVAANPPRPPPPRATPLQVPLPPPRATPVASTSIPNRQQNQQSSSARNPYAAATSNATATTSAASNPYQSNATSAPSNPYQNSNNSNNNSVNGSQNSAGPSNPYQNNNSNNNSMNGSQNSRDSASGAARMRPPPRPQQPQPPPPATNRLYDDDLYDDDAIPIQDDMEDLMMVDSNTNSNHPASRNTNSSSMPIAAHGSSSRPRHDRVSTMPVPPPPAAAAVSRVSGAAGGTLLQAISFVELRNRLVRARENEELYRQMFGQSFVVQARQKGVKLEFNIEKIKGSSKEAKKAKKYGYYMSARFQDGTINGELVSCKISNEILEPFFSLPPSEMRKLNREDRKRSEELIRNGGKHVQDALFQPRTYETTLLLTPDEFFRSESDPIPPLDGSIPILHLIVFISD